MKLTKEQIDKFKLELSRFHRFQGHSKDEIFKLGMKQALKIIGIEFPK